MNYKNCDNNTDTESKKNNSENSTDNIDAFLKNLDITLPNLEKIGAAFLAIGYSTFLSAANLDIADALDVNDSGIVPFSVFVSGQKLNLIGYTILWIVSAERVKEAKFKINNTNEDINLNAFLGIEFSYLLSIYANFIRLQSFLQLEAMDINKNSTE
ncbi:hypothetical protein [Clostridium botulinum]|uniref:hypothetical protein n=1 Tax=Clostridium botulinum TaxID=1491 RepID=UPI0013FAB7D9|nr:hypothetical protein [Clostridium botulinum]MBY6809592.1 hypothetical protein [Clostridium botulinum]MBY6823034.1 hypothetical protein [Clostridium botulinum]MBY6833646.1 hypothetical protein [Clostridium botulinum]MBY6971707.1 hypothetical protein [Clostridium botulinum]NFO15679.1 hypothetical protein [Clostridium botulinum]